MLKSIKAKVYKVFLHLKHQRFSRMKNTSYEINHKRAYDCKRNP